MTRYEYEAEIMEMASALSPEVRGKFISVMFTETRNPVMSQVLSIFVGGLGIDRFYIGDILLGILKLITVGGLGIWFVIDWFLIAGRTRDKNIEAALYIFQTIQRREALRE